MTRPIFGKRGPGGNNSAVHTAQCAAIREYLRVIGGWEFKVTGSIFQRPGVPDILACVPPHGTLLGIEVKTGKGEPRENQIQEMDAITAAGGLSVVVGNMDELDEFLYYSGVIDRLMNSSYQRPLVFPQVGAVPVATE